MIFVGQKSHKSGIVDMVHPTPIYLVDEIFDFKKYSRESWLSKNNFGNHTHMHCHNTADIVATYYYETNENDGDLIIQPPQFLETSLCFQQERYLYKPKKGRLIFFPVFLYHGVKTNTTNNERISMSMSIYFER